MSVDAVAQNLSRSIVEHIAGDALRGNDDVQQRDHRIRDERGDETQKTVTTDLSFSSTQLW